MLEKMSDDQLLARSIEYSAAGIEDRFEKDYQATLVSANSSVDLDMSSDQNCIIVHMKGGDALPYRKGDWVQVREAKGSMFSVGVYKKHR